MNRPGLQCEPPQRIPADELHKKQSLTRKPFRPILSGVMYSASEHEGEYPDLKKQSYNNAGSRSSADGPGTLVSS